MEAPTHGSRDVYLQGVKELSSQRFWGLSVATESSLFPSTVEDCIIESRFFTHFIGLADNFGSLSTMRSESIGFVEGSINSRSLFTSHLDR